MYDSDNQLQQYILDHIDAEPETLRQVYRQTHLHHLYPRMCSGHYQGRLLKMLTAMINPRRVLEIGTFTGYATISIAEALSPNAVIDTIEIDTEKEDELLLTFQKSGYGDKINLIIGDALDIIPSLNREWDMVFIDGNKRNYIQYLEAVYPCTREGGFILADNTLWDMKVADGNDHHDAQTKSIMTFNDEVAADSRFEKIILPVRDGLTILRKI